MLMSRAPAIAYLAVCLILVVPHTAVARPPPNANPAFKSWFESLHDPDGVFPCCSVSDCRLTESRVTGNHYEALIEGEWLAVPPEKVLHHTDNPTGQAVACWSEEMGILCFIPGPGT
jgi:hypothetical protein